SPTRTNRTSFRYLSYQSRNGSLSRIAATTLAIVLRSQVSRTLRRCELPHVPGSGSRAAGSEVQILSPRPFFLLISQLLHRRKEPLREPLRLREQAALLIVYQRNRNTTISDAEEEFHPQIRSSATMWDRTQRTSTLSVVIFIS